MTILGVGPARRAWAAPIVTLTLSINDDGAGNYAPGQFAVFASDSLDNGGIAGLGITLGGNWTSDTVVAPRTAFPNPNAPTEGIYEGFNVFPKDSTSPIFLSQFFASPGGNGYPLPTFESAKAVYGFGQASASLPVGDLYARQLDYSAQLLLLQGTFDGSISLIGGDFTNANTYVFDSIVPPTEAPSTEFATVQFVSQTLPEPAAGAIVIVGFIGLLARAPRRSLKGRAKSRDVLGVIL